MMHETVLGTVSRLVAAIQAAIDSGDLDAEERLWGELVAACGRCDWQEAI